MNRKSHLKCGMIAIAATLNHSQNAIYESDYCSTCGLQQLTTHTAKLDITDITTVPYLYTSYLRSVSIFNQILNSLWCFNEN